MNSIAFNRVFKGADRDNRLSEKLATEHAGILQWAIDGAVKWAASGLAIPQRVVAASRDYMSEQNDLQQWMQDCCHRAADATVSAAEAYASFRQWKDANGEHAPSVKSFSQRLERMFDKRHTRHGRVFHGLRLASQPMDAAPENRSAL